MKVIDATDLVAGRLASVAAKLALEGETIRIMSRCGLGQTSPNPVLTTLKNFRYAYELLIQQRDDGLQLSFDLSAAVQDAERIAGRQSARAD